MPKINVYLPDDLAGEVRAAQLPVSAICQVALRDALERGSGSTAVTVEDVSGRTLLSPHVASVVALAPAAAARRGSAVVESEDLLQALLDEEESLILRAIEHLGFSRTRIQAALDKTVVTSDPVPEKEVRIGPGSLGVLADAADDARATGVDYVNGGNLVWALANARTGSSRKVLDGIGFRDVVTHQVIGLVEVGVSYGRRTRQSGQASILAELSRIGDRLDTLERRIGGG